MERQATDRHNDEGPPGGMPIQLAGGAPVKGHLSNDEQVIAQPIPERVVASLLATQGMNQPPPLPVAGICLL